MTNEQTLLERAQAFDEDALGQLYDEYAPPIYAYLYRRVQDAQLAEDLTSEVFVRMLQAIRARRLWKTSFQGWLYRIAHNLVVDHYRKQPATPVLEQGDQQRDRDREQGQECEPQQDQGRQQDQEQDRDQQQDPQQGQPEDQQQEQRQTQEQNQEQTQQGQPEGQQSSPQGGR